MLRRLLITASKFLRKYYIKNSFQHKLMTVNSTVNQAIPGLLLRYSVLLTDFILLVSLDIIQYLL